MKTNTNLKSASGQIPGILEVKVLRFRKKLLREVLVLGPNGDEVWLGEGDTLKLHIQIDVGST